MANVLMKRSAIEQDKCDHAGLYLDRGFKQWKDDNNRAAGTQEQSKHNEDILAHHKSAAKIKPSPAYKQAYKDWKKIQVSALIAEKGVVWFGQLVSRLYLGAGNASPLEAAITLHHVYGMPYIPGSAIKGVLHHYLLECVDDEQAEASELQKIMAVLFGKEASKSDSSDSGSAGYIIINDAWYVPNTKNPLVPETITTHSTSYYKTFGATGVHPDFESPNPNPQIAIEGSFLFSIEGDKKLAAYAIKLLEKVLSERGIGAKTASGYGYFSTDENLMVDFLECVEKQKQATSIANMSADEKFLYELTGSIQHADNPAIALLTRLEEGEWEGSGQMIVVANKIKSIMKEAGKWRPEFDGTNKIKLKDKQKSQRVQKFLPS